MEITIKLNRNSIEFETEDFHLVIGSIPKVFDADTIDLLSEQQRLEILILAHEWLSKVLLSRQIHSDHKHCILNTFLHQLIQKQDVTSWKLIAPPSLKPFYHY